MANPVLENWVASDTGGATASSLTLTAPSGITADELLLIIVGSDDATDTIQFSTSASGWTKLTENTDGATPDAHVAIFWKIATGSEGNVTVDHASNDELMGWYLRVSGADTTTPIDLYGTATYQNSTAVIIANTVSTPDSSDTTPSVDECLEIFGSITDGGDTLPIAEQTGFTIHSRALISQHSSGTGGNDVAGVLGTGQQTTATAVGVIIGDMPGSLSDGSVGFYLLVAPAADTGINVTPTSLATAAAIGVHALDLGTLSLAATSLASVRALQTPAVNLQLDITAGSLASVAAVDGSGVTYDVNEYHFNGSTSVTDIGFNWTNDWQAYDGLLTTEAIQTPGAIGSVGSNDLQIVGNTAPDYGGDIAQVRCRLAGGANGAATANAEILDGAASLGVAQTTGFITDATYGSWVTLDAPVGGWTWAKVKALKASCYTSDAAQNTAVAKIDLEVSALPTYYFDASDSGPTDNDAAWINDANVFDGSTASLLATCSFNGTATTNELRGTGTTAPASGGDIAQVRCRLYGGVFVSDNNTLEAEIFSSGESLGSCLNTVDYTAEDWGAWADLTAPTGGWSWAKLQSLEVAVFGYSDAGGWHKEVGVVEIEVTTGGGTTISLTAAATTITPTAVATVAALGSPTIDLGTLGITAGSLASAAAVASPVLTLSLAVTAGSVATVAVVDSPAIDLGSLGVTASSLTGLAAIQEPGIFLAAVVITATAASRIPTIGDPTISFALGITASSLSSGAQVGDPGLALQLDVQPDTVSAVAAVTPPSLTLQLTVAAASLVSVSGVSDPGISFALNITPDPVATVAALQNPAIVLGTLEVTATSLASVAAIGTHSLVFTLDILVTALPVASGAGVEAPSLDMGSISITAGSVSSVVALGTPGISFALTVTPTSVASMKALEAPVVTLGVLLVSASSLAHIPAIGAPTVDLGVIFITPEAVSGQSGMGIPALGLNLNIPATSQGSLAAVSTAAISLTLTITASSLAPLSGIGIPTMIIDLGLGILAHRIYIEPQLPASQDVTAQAPTPVAMTAQLVESIKIIKKA